MTNRKVLVIDDDARYLELVKFMLEDAGFDVCTETDSRRVLMRIASNRPEVIVTDVLMPELDGVELGKLLKIEQDTAVLPIVYVSAWTGAQDRELPRGAIRLMKPFTTEELVSAINNAIEGSASKEADRVTSE
jgi:DNA-binding response OmpR family regulator